MKLDTPNFTKDEKQARNEAANNNRKKVLPALKGNTFLRPPFGTRLCTAKSSVLCLPFKRRKNVCSPSAENRPAAAVTPWTNFSVFSRRRDSRLCDRDSRIGKTASEPPGSRYNKSKATIAGCRPEDFHREEFPVAGRKQGDE